MKLRWRNMVAVLGLLSSWVETLSGVYGSKMIDFIYYTPDLDDRVCGWIDGLCREWHSSCFISRSDETRLWARKDGGECVRVKDFGNSSAEFRAIIERTVW